jgi:hypothetical protein
MQSSNIFVAG